MTTETYEDTRPATIRYTIYSLELAPYCPDLPEGSDEDWSDEAETILRDFADRYGDALLDDLIFEFPFRPIRVDVVHATTGGGSTNYIDEPDVAERVQEIAGRVLERLTTEGA